MANVRDKIETQERDEDGYWVYLKAGWQDSHNPGCHTIVEDSKAEALRKAREAIPCKCKECTRG